MTEEASKLKAFPDLFKNGRHIVRGITFTAEMVELVHDIIALKRDIHHGNFQRAVKEALIVGLPQVKKLYEPGRTVSPLKAGGE